MSGTHEIGAEVVVVGVVGPRGFSTLAATAQLPVACDFLYTAAAVVHGAGQALRCTLRRYDALSGILVSSRL